MVNINLNIFLLILFISYNTLFSQSIKITTNNLEITKAVLFFLEGEKTEQFFVQFVYTKLGQNSVDYHFFSDGSVLREEFIGDDLVLGPVSVFEIEKSELDSLKKKFDSEFFDSKSSLDNCPLNGLAHGYLEVMNNDKYNFSWTCGTLDSRVDIVFNELMEEYG